MLTLTHFPNTNMCFLSAVAKFILSGTYNMHPSIHTHTHASLYPTIFDESFTFLSDINECRAGTAQCHLAADCTNTVGFYRCDCKSGYSGDGTSTCTGETAQQVYDVTVNCEAPSLPILPSSQCSMTGVTKAVVCAILSVGWCISNNPCC